MTGQAFLFALLLVGATSLSLLASYWGWALRWRRARLLDARQSFLARLRRIDVGIQEAQRLPALMTELEELVEDLRASPRLFRSQDALIASIAEVVGALRSGGGEEQYRRRYAQNIALVKQAMRSQIVIDTRDTRSTHV